MKTIEYIRTLIDGNGQLWLVSSDVSKAVFGSYSHRWRRRIPELEPQDRKEILIPNESGTKRWHYIISEFGVSRLIHTERSGDHEMQKRALLSYLKRVKPKEGLESVVAKDDTELFWVCDPNKLPPHTME